jgi:hypothetical protein
MDMGEPGEVLGTTADDGTYALQLEQPSLPSGGGDLRFQVVDRGGSPLRRYAVEGTRKLHLIIVRHDFAGYQHLHPALGSDGTWSVPVHFATDGTYRVIADFTPKGSGGDKHVLARDLRVGTGSPAQRPFPESNPMQQVDGFSVHLATFDLEAGREGTMAIHVRRDGAAPDLQPYLGALGHAVVLREGDYAYLHVHPSDPVADAGAVSFQLTLPAAARYVAFVQFRVDGAVHTATFALDARNGKVDG